MSQKGNISEKDMRFRSGVMGGLIAISFIILQDFISTDKLDIAEFISIVAFSVSLPILGGVLSFYQLWVRDEYYYMTRLSNLIEYQVSMVGIAFSIIGVIAAFWHVSWIAGLIFTLATLIMLIFHYIYLDSANSEEMKSS